MPLFALMSSSIGGARFGAAAGACAASAERTAMRCYSINGAIEKIGYSRISSRKAKAAG